MPYKYYEDEAYYLRTSMSETQREYQKWLFHYIDKFIASSVAEIGPGDGFFGKLLSDKYEYTGFEPAQKSYEACLRRNINVVHGYFSAGKGDFKTIIARQVLEHISDIQGFMSVVKNTLTEDGVVIFEVPNIEKARKLNRLVDFCPEHLNYFTAASLSVCLSSNGFNIEHVEKTYDDEYLLVVAKRFAQFRYRDVSLDFSNMVFWGAGSRGISLCHLLRAYPKYFIDSDTEKTGKYIPSTDIEIKSPDYFFKDTESHSVVITSFFYFDEVIKTIRNNGFTGDIYRIDEKMEIEKM